MSIKDKLRKRQTPEWKKLWSKKIWLWKYPGEKSSTNCSIKAKTTNLSNGTISVLRLLSTVYCLKGNKTDVPYTDNDTSKLRGECERVVYASLFNSTYNLVHFTSLNVSWWIFQRKTNKQRLRFVIQKPTC